MIGAEGSPPVAILSVYLGGEVRTREGNWQLGIEHSKGSWAVVARTTAERREVGRASQSWLPWSYRIRLGAHTTYRLTENPVNGRLTLAVGRQSVARLALKLSTAVSRRSKSPTRLPQAMSLLEVGKIEIFTTRHSAARLALPIVLAFEMVKAERAIPTLDGQAPY